MTAAVDVVVICAVVLSGVVLGRSVGLRGALTLPIGTLIGIAGHMAATHIAVLAGLNSPALIGFFAISIAGACRWFRASLNPYWLSVALIIGAALRWGAAPYTYLRHVDSVNYMIISGLLMRNNGDLANEVNSLQLKKRMIGAPTMHAVQTLTDMPMSVLLGPWVGIMIVVTVGVAIRHVGSSLTAATIAAVLTCLALATSSRFLMHVTYLNSHLMNAFAVVALMAVVVTLADNPQQQTMLKLAIWSGFTILISARPEGFLTAGVIAVAVLLDGRVTGDCRRTIARAFSVVTMGTFTTQLVVFATRDQFGFDDEIVLPLIAGAIVLLASPLIGLTRPMATVQTTYVVIAATVLGVAFLISRDTALIRGMLSAWWGNYVTDGHWGWTVIVGFPASVIAGMLAWRDPRIRTVTLAVGAFPVIGVVTSILREGPGRVSDADSFNRMTMHIFPLMLMLIGLALASALAYDSTSTERVRLRS